MTATISVISPNRADVVDQTSLAVGAGRDAVLNLGAQQVAYGNRGAGEPHLAATNVAGDYYLVVSLEAAEGAARVDVPYVVGVEAVGSEQRRPNYRGEMPPTRRVLRPVTPPFGSVSRAPNRATTKVDGVAKGFDYDMALGVAEGMGVDPEFVEIEFDELLRALRAGRIDMVGAQVSKTPELELHFDFSVSYLPTYVAFLTPEDSTIHSRGDFNGKNIAVVDGTIYEAEHAPIGFVVRDRDHRKDQIDEAPEDMIRSGQWLKIKTEYFEADPLAEAFNERDR